MNPKQITYSLSLAQLLHLPLIRSLMLCLPLVTVQMAQALPADKEQSIKISSESAAIDSKLGVTTLTGSVKLIQGTLEINADKVTLRYDKNQKLESLVAEGLPARYQQQPAADKALIHAEADSIIYTVSKDHLTLDKNAFVEQNGATTRGGKIDYNITSGTVNASGAGNGSGRVEFVIPPQTNKKE
ncbi:MAG: lipopolysaccharide transport periplasmic protein LptA [Pseudomonadota bacterium]